ncbi:MULTISPECIES: hypothetical protein [unclassified Veillonella]|uniref:Uncharacterized protein n=1 Tax=Veillonella orientalis TaxID=2682455 RepID=A0ABN5XV17_9FIRM|nr:MULTISPECIES: hypothetical protein [unclassified Veillonella]ETJ22603.1 MAG: hypothetical protein Q620_VSAC00159G0001 [Veillonella sp. DORA_A_3_16_22]MBS4891648.1 hypothetical protein [Veillonella sp.]BBU35490.1 hypothetical protein VEIS1202513_00110 [Veillonella sp. S12025-13]
MDVKEPFYNGEKLYRAIKPIPTMWKTIDNKRVPSSAVFKDSKGVSVDRQDSRENKVAIEYLSSTKEGYDILSITVNNCEDLSIVYQIDPIEDNPYHSLILRSIDKIELTSSQAKHLAKVAKLEKVNESD